MNEHGRNESDISRYTDVEYTPEGYENVYRWDDFLEIAGGHVYNAMDTIDLVSTGGEYEGFNPRYAYTCEFVGCSTLVDGIALFRPMSRDGEDLAGAEKKPDPAEAAAAAKRAAGSTGGDGAGDAGAIKL